METRLHSIDTVPDTERWSPSVKLTWARSVHVAGTRHQDAVGDLEVERQELGPRRVRELQLSQAHS